jgi:hypothetical protein
MVETAGIRLELEWLNESTVKNDQSVKSDGNVPFSHQNMDLVNNKHSR